VHALVEALERHPGVREARFWLFSEQAYAAFHRSLADAAATQ
jgi:O-acetyl-ADP-ribose deacetylase